MWWQTWPISVKKYLNDDDLCEAVENIVSQNNFLMHDLKREAALTINNQMRENQALAQSVLYLSIYRLPKVFF